MASFDLLTWNGSTLKTKRIPSSSNTIDLLSVRVGASNLEMKETSGNFDFAAKKLVNIVAGTATGHVVEYDQMNTAIAAMAQGLKPKQAVRAASTANIVLASALINGATVDTVTLATGDRVLVKNQTTASENGIYIVAVSGAASRSTDMDSLSPIDEINGAYTFVQEGSQAGQGWVQSGTVVTLGVTALNFVYFNNINSLVGGDMIALSSSTISVDLATTSGLESSNPGNVAGQLRIKLEASNPTLAIDGSNQLGVKLNAAGAIVTGASGLLVQTDGSTTEINGSNQVIVKAAGVTGTQLATSVAGAGLAGGGGSALSVNTGDGTKIASDAVVADYATTLTNDNAGSITVRQAVYVKANGNVDLAQANVATLGDFVLGIVEDASIATTAAGKITTRRGAVIGGYSSLTPGKLQYVSRSTAGALVEVLTGFVAGEFVYSAGRALSATQIIFDPQFIMEF